MPVWTVRPCQATSRGRPTLTESRRAIACSRSDCGSAVILHSDGVFGSLVVVRHCEQALQPANLRPICDGETKTQSGQREATMDDQGKLAALQRHWDASDANDFEA